MKHRKGIRRIYFILLVALAWQTQIVAAETETQGYHCVFLGHSFFCPIAKGFEGYAVKAGFPEHRQIVKMGGGKRGCPGWFWDQLPENDNAREAIRSGQVDLVGFTYHPMGQCAYEDYQLWVDFALEHNTNTAFFIGLSWPRQPETPSVMFEAGYALSRKYLAGMLSRFKKEYPGTTFFFLPYGKGVVELRKRFGKGDIPDIKYLVKSKDEPNAPHLFRDKLGHAAAMPIDISRLIWLAVIYNVDLRDYEWNSNYSNEDMLKQIARQVATSDPLAQW